MPFCPECKTEYRAGFTDCVDCHTALQPNEPATEDEAFVEVLSTNDREDIELAKQVLADARIEYFVRDLRDAAFPTTVGVEGERRIAVPASQRTEAVSLLAEAATDGALSESGTVLDAG